MTQEDWESSKPVLLHRNLLQQARWRHEYRFSKII